MKFIVGLCASLILSSFALAEVTHDPAQCPDLDGQFVIPDKTFGDMNFTIQMKDNAGIKSLVITNEEDNVEETLELDGIQGAATGGWSTMSACFNQHVYVYEYENAAVHRTSILSLLANTDLFIEIEDKEGTSEVTANRR